MVKYHLGNLAGIAVEISSRSTLEQFNSSAFLPGAVLIGLKRKIFIRSHPNHYGKLRFFKPRF